MSKRNKKILLVIFIILLVSVALILSKFGSVSAGSETITANQTESGDALEEGNDEKPISPFSKESVAMSLLKLFGALIVVIVAIYGFLYLLKMMMGQKFSGNRSNNLIEVLETTYIAQKKSVSLVRFSDRAVLVGVSDTGMTALAELTAQETAGIMADYAAGKTPSGFKSILKDAKTRIMPLNMKKIKVAQASR